MKIIRFRSDGRPSRHGILRGEQMEMIRGDILGSWEPSGSTFDLAQVELFVPLDPPNVLCLGKKCPHIPGRKNPKFPQTPLLFIKSTNAVVGPGQPIIFPAMAPDQVYHEAELAVVIGRRTIHIAENEASQFIFGYTIANDIGAKDCQASDGQWARAKSFDTFCPLGPWIETDLDPGNCRVRSRINGVMVQDSDTSLMFFSVAQTVSFLSKCMTLLPGTVICMGSPGTIPKPRPFLKPGDQVQLEIAGIGTMTNRVRAELAK